MSEIPDERNEFCKQAEKDWERFLLMRARELSKGKKTRPVTKPAINDESAKFNTALIEKLLPK